MRLIFPDDFRSSLYKNEAPNPADQHLIGAVLLGAVMVSVQSIFRVRHPIFSVILMWLCFILLFSNSHAQTNEPSHEFEGKCDDVMFNPENFSFTPVYDHLENLADYYITQGDYTEGLPFADQLLDFSLKCHGNEDLAVGISLYWLGYYRYNLQQHGKVKDLMLRSAENIKAGKTYRGAQLDEKFQVPPWQSGAQFRQAALGRTLNFLAGFLAHTGKDEEAIAFYETLLKTGKEIHEISPAKKAAVLGNYANSLITLGRFQDAKKMTVEAIDIIEKLEQGKTQVVFYLQKLGLIHENLNELDEAAEVYKRAIEMAKKDLGEDHVIHAIYLESLGNVLLEQKKYGNARDAFHASLTIHEKKYGISHRLLIRTLVSLAETHFATGDQQAALAIVERALKIDNSQYQDEFQSFQDSYFTIEEAESPQTRLINLYLKIAYQKHEKTGEQIVESSARAFEHAQRLRHSQAAVSIKKMSERFLKGLDLADLVREKQDLEERWKYYQSLRLTQLQRGDAGLPKLNEFQGIEKRIIELEKQITTKDFQFSDLLRPEPIFINELQKGDGAALKALLKSDEALLYFIDTPAVAPAKEETFIWVVTNNDIKWFRSSLGSKALGRAVKTLRCGLDGVSSWGDQARASECEELVGARYDRSQFLRGRPLPFDVSLAHRLYKELLGPAKELIKGKNLLLVPSGPLTSLPFQVLITREPDGRSPLKEMAWLIHEHELTVLPSAASLKALRRHSPRGVGKTAFLGFGNPLLSGKEGSDQRAFNVKPCDFATLSANDGKSLKVAGDFALRGNISQYYRGGKVDVAKIRQMNPLPETADELCAVAKIVQGEADAVYLGKAATEAAVKRLSAEGKLKEARVVHFATHGLLAGETGDLLHSGAEPALVLSPPVEGAASAEDDGLLTASEITQLKLDADWVILSACNTAGGEKSGAEPLSGLAKAFFYAGARALLLSHWYVDSRATVELVRKSFRAGVTDRTLGRAGQLRAAMREMISEELTAHPSLWAPFVVVGEAGRRAEQ